MTATPSANAAQAAGSQVPPRSQPTGSAWSGWIIFAGIMLMLVGTYQLIAGLAALFNDKYYLVGSSGLVVHVNYTAWGWVHIGLAAINILAGFGVMTGRGWARIWAILVAGVSAIINLGFTGAYPIWVIMMVTIDVIVIYALSVHWDEMKALR